MVFSYLIWGALVIFILAVAISSIRSEKRSEQSFTRLRDYVDWLWQARIFPVIAALVMILLTFFWCVPNGGSLNGSGDPSCDTRYSC